MKRILMNYALRAHDVTCACDDFSCATGHQLGLTDPVLHLRNAQREKYRQKPRFPKDIGFVPVAVFSVGVTCRLVTSVLGAAVMRVGLQVLRR